MYPKTTFLTKRAEKYHEDLFRRGLLKHNDMKHSHLFLRDDEHSLYQFFHINMPYLIVYEAVNIKSNKSIYMEFSESNIISTGVSYREFSQSSLRLHSHDFYELSFVLSGQLTIKIENEIMTYHPGECCLCNKNIHHVEIMDQDTEIILFLLKEDYIHEVLEKNYYYDDLGNAHSAGTFFHTFYLENSKNQMYDAKVYIDFRITSPFLPEAFYEIINRMIAEISSIHSGKSHMMKALFCRFIEMLENDQMYHSEIHWAKLSNDEQIVYRIAKAYEEKNGIFSRSEIEKITGYNGDYVERIMKRNTGSTLSEYGQRFLVKRISQLLIHSDLPIGAICEQAGYCNRNYFNKLFQRYYGMTPSEYRRKHRKP